jgi:hypothetical protein
VLLIIGFDEYSAYWHTAAGAPDLSYIVSHGVLRSRASMRANRVVVSSSAMIEVLWRAGEEPARVPGERTGSAEERPPVSSVGTLSPGILKIAVAGRARLMIAAKDLIARASVLNGPSLVINDPARDMLQLDLEQARAAPPPPAAAVYLAARHQPPGDPGIAAPTALPGSPGIFRRQPRSSLPSIGSGAGRCTSAGRAPLIARNPANVPPTEQFWGRMPGGLPRRDERSAPATPDRYGNARADSSSARAQRTSHPVCAVSRRGHSFHMDAAFVLP